MTSGKSRTTPLSAKVFRLAHVRKQRECEQVAAVCYRLRGGEIEFLLVRTGSGHWTFPKGGVEPGLSHAQAAALEAFEEAGVHGRMEEACFARYVRHKRRAPGKVAKELSEREVATSAHLCLVLRLVRPQEANRKPTWFSASKVKTKLGEGRTQQFGAELVRVVDRAVARIQKLNQAQVVPEDALQKVRFEASASPDRDRRIAKAAALPESSWRPDPTASAGRAAVRGKLLQLGPSLVVNAVTARNQKSAASTQLKRKPAGQSASARRSD